MSNSEKKNGPGSTQDQNITDVLAMVNDLVGTEEPPAILEMATSDDPNKVNEVEISKDLVKANELATAEALATTNELAATESPSTADVLTTAQAQPATDVLTTAQAQPTTDVLTTTETPAANSIDAAMAPEKVSILLVDHDHARRAFFNTILSRSTKANINTEATLSDTMSHLDEMGHMQNLALLVIDFDLLQNTSISGELQRLVSHPVAANTEIVLMADELPTSYDILIRECGVRFTLPRNVGAKILTESISTFLEEALKTKEIKESISKMQQAIYNKDARMARELLETKLANRLEDFPELFYLVGECLILENTCEAAKLILIEFITKKQPPSLAIMRCVTTIGKALCIQGRFAEATKLYDKISSISPLNISHLLNSGDAMMAQNLLPLAAERFDKVLQIDPTNPDACAGIAKISFAENDFDKGLAALAKARSPVESLNLASYLNNAAISLLKSSRVAEAIGLFERSLIFFNKYRYIVEFNMGLAYMHANNLNKACALFEKVIATTPPFVEKKEILKKYKKLGKENFCKLYEK